METLRGTICIEVLAFLFDQWLLTVYLVGFQAAVNAEMSKLRKMLEDEVHQREKREEEISMLQNQLLQISFDADEVRVCD